MNDFCREYAAALYMLAKECNCEEDFSEQLAEVEKIFYENPEYIKILSLPTISNEEKNTLLDEALRGVHEHIKSFIKLLKDRHAINEFSGCVKAFSQLYDDERGVERAVAISALPLTDTELEKIKLNLSEMTGKSIVLENKVDSSILGGVLLRFGGKEINGSVKMRLDDMRNTLVNS